MNGRSAPRAYLSCARIAQLVEQRIRNAKVIGSIPVSGMFRRLCSNFHLAREPRRSPILPPLVPFPLLQAVALGFFHWMHSSAPGRGEGVILLIAARSVGFVSSLQTISIGQKKAILE
jgi:hypothetical protein